MKVLRATVVKPLKGHEKEVTEIIRELNTYLSGLPGFVMGYEIREGEFVGKVTIWESQDAVNHAGTQAHNISLRSRLHRLSEADMRERLFQVTSEIRGVAP